MDDQTMDGSEGREGEPAMAHASANLPAREHGVSGKLAHSTPDPDAEPPLPKSIPDDIPPPAHAPVQEPTLPEPPIKADQAQ